MASIINPLKSVNLNWKITNDTVVFGAHANNYVTLQYTAGNIDAGANTNNFYVSKYSSPIWTSFTPSARTATTTTFGGTALNGTNINGEYLIGE